MLRVLFLALAFVTRVVGVRAEEAGATAAANEKPAARFVKTWGREGAGEGEFNIPIGIAISSKNEIYVTDHYNGRVHQFDVEGKAVRIFPVMPNPGGIALSQAGGESPLLFISHFPISRLDKEQRPDRVTVYRGDGTFVREFGRTGKGDGEFRWPGGIAIGPQGELFVADQTNHRIQVVTAEGKFLRAWGAHGLKPGEFGGNFDAGSRIGGPNFVAFDSAGHLYTTEAAVGRVQKFDCDGKSLLSWGDNEEKPGSFGGVFTGFKTSMQGPLGIAVDAKDRLWITSVNGRVQQFASDGKFLRGFGGKQGVEPGEFFAPHGIALDRHGKIYVVDTYNHRIQKFEPIE